MQTNAAAQLHGPHFQIASQAAPRVRRQDEVAVLIPCYNEEITVGKVIDGFRNALPDARILVFDNNSTDQTAAVALTHGAEVIRSPKQGKGSVVQHMFEEVDAQVYIMVDGDDTYPADAAPRLIRRMLETGADMVVGVRMNNFAAGSFRRFHTFGNRLVAGLISRLFGIRVSDVLSGYRAFSREFVKSVPLRSPGFEIETELTLQAAAKQFKIEEVPIKYGTRPAGSFSKLNTFSDGYLVLRAILSIFKNYKPQIFFSLVAAVFAIASLAAGAAPVADYLRTRYVSHVPLAVLAASLAVVSVVSFGIGIILDTVYRYHNESFRLWRKQLGRH